jgi:hypothetical protein
MLTLNITILNQVIEEAQRSSASHPRWLAAIARAARELEGNPYMEALDDHTLLIGSPSGNTYIGNGTCQCEAYRRGIPCWHRAAARLYMRYIEAEARAAQSVNLLSLGTRLAKARAEMEELFA